MQLNVLRGQVNDADANLAALDVRRQKEVAFLQKQLAISALAVEKFEADLNHAKGTLDPAQLAEIEARASFRKQVTTCMGLMNEMRAQIAAQADGYEAQLSDLRARLGRA